MLSKITIITPNYNQGEFLERTILSVLNQGYDNLEYIVVDGGSTDNSVAIIKKYEQHLAYWVSERDGGMYEAVGKGFARATGDIMGWLNSDDILFTGALSTIAETFSRFPEVKWVTGMPVSVDERDRIISFQPVQSWSRLKIISGQYRWIQQESTYWRRELWHISGGSMDPGFSLAGDFELWARFFRHEKLYSLHFALAGFRKRSQNQKSLDKLKPYVDQVLRVLQREKVLLTASEKRTVMMIQVTRWVVGLLAPDRIKKRGARFLRKLQALPPVISLHRISNSLTFTSSK